jgi:hypothetical protein
MALLSVPIVPFIIMGIMVAGILIVSPIAFVMSKRRYENIQQNGICVDAVVVANESRTKSSDIRYNTTVVRFVGNDGLYHDCDLWYSSSLPIGRRLKIQYIPGQYNKVLFVSQEIGSENEQ